MFQSHLVDLNILKADTIKVSLLDCEVVYSGGYIVDITVKISII
jgi:hypothetical protein